MNEFNKALLEKIIEMIQEIIEQVDRIAND